MLVVGLTGSIAMGKSTVAGMLAELGAPVFDADAAVRVFYAGIGARLVEAAFPGVLGVDGIDRERLAQRVLEDRVALRQLESIAHPAVARARAEFLDQARAGGRRVVVVDVPLLFETGAEATVDIIVVASAPAETQRSRALKREGMTTEKLDRILSRQTPDSMKRQRAHIVLDTSAGFREMRLQVRQLLRAAAAMEGRWDA
jgi:dephospho-CoA kinase